MRKRINMFVVLAMILVVGLLCGTTVQAKTIKKITVDMKADPSPRKAIQAVFDEIGEDKGNDVLYEVTIPAGTYKIDGVLRVFSNTYVKMNGVTFVRCEAKSMLHLGEDTDKFYGYNGYHDITFEGGTWDGNGKSNSKYDVSLIRLGHGKNIAFKNVTFKNARDSHHVEMAACQNVSFEKCTFNGYYGKKTSNNEALQVDVMHNATHFPMYAYFDDTPSSDIFVKNCTFTNLQRGVGTHSAVAGSYHENMVIEGNTFKNIDGYAIICTNYRNAKIANNVITDAGAGILFRNMVQGHNNFYTPLSGKAKINNNSNSEISGNKITVTDKKYKTTAYGISLYGEKLSKKYKDAPKGDYTLKQVTVTNNTITMKNSGYGIWLQGTMDSTVYKNKVTMDIKSSVSGKGNADCIRLVKSKNNTIDTNTLTQKKKNKKTEKACGIVVTTSSSAVIKNNKINNSPKDGIFVVSKSQATITNNVIKKTGRYGLNVCEKSKVTAKKNKMSKCGKRKTNTYAGGKIKK